MSEKNRKSAIEAAYSYLDTRMRTCAEVERKLKEKGYDEDEILEAVNELTGMRYLDDYQYALRYYEYNREKRRGSGRAARELAEKGVDKDAFFAQLDKMASDALESGSPQNTMRVPSKEDLIGIYKKLF